MLSRDSKKGHEPSLHLAKRFCGITLFFLGWAAARHWPHPVYYLSNMLKVAFAVCLAFALIRRERFADRELNYWDEAFGYIATAFSPRLFRGLKALDAIQIRSARGFRFALTAHCIRPPSPLKNVRRENLYGLLMVVHPDAPRILMRKGALPPSGTRLGSKKRARPSGITCE